MITFWLVAALMTLLTLGILLYPLLAPQKIAGSAGNLMLKTAPSIWVAVLMCILVPAISVILYKKLGASEQVHQYHIAQQKEAVLHAEIEKLGNLPGIINALKSRVQENPDARGWFLLGRLYLKSRQFAEAVHAFAQANNMAPGQIDILLGYAEALYFANHESLNAQAKSLLNTVLQLQPNNREAMNLLAADAQT